MDQNPYQSPQASLEPASDSIVRAARSELATLIRRFLSEDLTVFEFEEELMQFSGTADSAVLYVAQEAWNHFEDSEDRLVSISKAEWDYFQRLLLLLESDYRVEATIACHWSPTQLIALFALAGFVIMFLQWGWDARLWLLTVPFGLVSMGLARFDDPDRKSEPYDRILFPFATFSDLHAAYHAARFKKTRYPRHLESRRLYPQPLRSIIYLFFSLLWLFCSPLVLMGQIYPTQKTHARVIS